MAAGLGFKTFATGDVLTAADTNGYLMQGVWVFADATARDAAVTSPQEGNTCYLKDTDVIQVYSGTAWVTKSGAASPLTTKGDLYTYSTTDTRLGVGTNGQVLTADSSTATGLKWASPSAADNWTLLNAGGTALTGAATITVSGISGQNKIMVVMDRASTANGSGSDFGVRVNGLTTNVYYGVGSVNYADDPYAFQMFQEWDFGNTTSRLPLAKTIDSASTASGSVTIQGCNSSGVKQFISVGAANYGSSSGHYRYSLQGYIDTSSTISSVSVFSVSGNFDAGTLYVYATA